MHTVDATRAVLSVMEMTLSFRNPAGCSSSILRASGFITREYLHDVNDETEPFTKLQNIIMQILAETCNVQRLINDTC
jgi:hypothetical protein